MNDLETAIAAALGEPGGVVIGWVLLAAWKGPETKETGYWFQAARGQPYHSTLGLLHHGIDAMREEGQ